MKDLHTRITAYTEELISSLQKLIQINSVEEEPQEGKPFGEGVDEALRFVLKLAEDMGFTTKYHEGYYGYIEMGTGEELIGLLAHLDVVPTGDPEKWSYPPFEAEIHDNKIYGRGAIDDKGPLLAALYAMKAVKDSGISINKRVRLILGTNEETHWKCILKYRELEEHPHYGFTPDSDFPLINAEKGLLQIKAILKEGASFTLKGGEALNSVPNLCQYEGKALDGLQPSEEIEFENGDSSRITFHGHSVHSAKSWEGKNALAIAATTLLGKKMTTPLVDFMAKEIGLDPYGKNIFGEDFQDQASGKITINMAKVVLDDSKQELSLDIRYPVTKSKEDVMTLLEEKFKKYQLEYEVLDTLPPLYVPEDHPLVKTLKNVYGEITHEDTTPISTGGATYARAFDNFVAFGAVFPNEEKLAHQRDEYIDIDSLLKCCLIYTKTLEALLQD